LGTAASNPIGHWAFGSSSRQWLVLSLLLAVVGMFGVTLASAALRGLSRFRSAAMLQVVTGALVPLCGVLLAEAEVERALMFTAALWIAIGVVVFAGLGQEWPRPAPSIYQIQNGIRELLVFGAPRVPADVGLFGLFALPAYAAVHRNDILGAGFLSVGLSLVQAIATVFASAGFVLLPYWSRAARTSEALAAARKRTTVLVVTSGLVATFCLCLFELCLEPIARILLGPLANAGLHDMRYVMLAAVPYVLYLVLRDYFDAISIFPMNAVAVTSALLIQFALLNAGWLTVPVATATSFLALGLIMLALWSLTLKQPESRWLGNVDQPQNVSPAD